ncbi:MAG TPA: DUF6089 family protein [Chitinophagaceae bacterium]|jgi:hypothetical protein|nr:DUF6089 family protein [Chitinophagaceae bacterium]HMU58475.1 DUF6089 family protein [Chitinophagaceae bacterium]
MKRTSIKVTLTAAALTVLFKVNAQIEKPKYEFGINLGFLVYQGDLTPKRLGSFETQKLSLGLHASRILSPSFSVRGNFVLGKLKGDESVYDNPEYRQQRNFKFSTPVAELAAHLVWSPLQRNYTDKGFAPYLFAGAGLAYLNIKRDWSGINASYFPEATDLWNGLAADTVHSLPKLLPVIPLGAGVKYFFTPKLAVNAESSYRLNYTDYLDGFSEAVNPWKNDHYLNYSVGIIYRTGKKNNLTCPKIRY